MHVLKTLLAQVKEFTRDSILTPIFMLVEVAMEMVIPLLMASIIDEGVNKGDMHHIFVIGAYMILAALVGLWAGMMGGKYGARASAGFARNLRKSMFANIQTFFESGGSGHQTDNRCDKLTELLSDDPAYGYACTGKSDRCHDHVLLHQPASGKCISDRSFDSCLCPLFDHFTRDQDLRLCI